MRENFKSECHNIQKHPKAEKKIKWNTEGILGKELDELNGKETCLQKIKRNSSTPEGYYVYDNLLMECTNKIRILSKKYMSRLQ